MYNKKWIDSYLPIFHSMNEYFYLLEKIKNNSKPIKIDIWNVINDYYYDMLKYE